VPAGVRFAELPGIRGPCCLTFIPVGSNTTFLDSPRDLSDVLKFLNEFIDVQTGNECQCVERQVSRVVALLGFKDNQARFGPVAL
jgi:hypothetical protein